MTGKNYKSFSAEDFALDTYFQKWILEDDHMTNLFWNKWLIDNPKKQEDVDLARKIIQQFRFKEYNASEEDFNEVWKNIKETQIKSTTTTLFSNHSKWYARAVASIVILILSILYISNNSNTLNENQIKVTHTPVKNVIVRGTDKAILTLENGFDVALTKGESYNTKNASSNGKEIIYSSNSTSKKIIYNYLTTPRGGQFFVELSDGTRVWLNSESRLKYPVSFLDNETRTVELVYGEAYFDVSPSTEHNGTEFKVLNQAQEVVVLGTEFNIKAYKDEYQLYTTLVEGEVAVNAMNKTEFLEPNQQLQLDVINNSTIISQVDIYREVSWKNGVFSFKNKSLKEIMKALERWYEIEVFFDNQALQNIVFSGTLKKKLSITDILETITAANNIEYEINNKTVLLK